MCEPNRPHLPTHSLASDLVETYFQIVHIRLPLLDPGLFRRKFHNPDGPDGPPFLPIVACVLAWGAKFSEHSVIHRDRDECSIGLLGERRRSRLIQMVAVRAQQVAEICKVYRVPSLENVQACLMLNVLEGGESWHTTSFGVLTEADSLDNSSGNINVPNGRSAWTVRLSYRLTLRPLVRLCGHVGQGGMYASRKSTISQERGITGHGFETTSVNRFHVLDDMLDRRVICGLFRIQATTVSFKCWLTPVCPC